MARGRKRRGSSTSLMKVAMEVGTSCFNAFLPSKPAPSPNRARGVARDAKLLRDLSNIVGRCSLHIEAKIPAKIPRIMGFVRIPFIEDFKEDLSNPRAFGPVKERMSTAATL